jgi:glycosyltransferase involved in cell wall biosynthesis
VQREQRLRDLEAVEDLQALRLAKLEAEKRVVEDRFERLRAIAADHQNSRVYKAMVHVGRWRPFHERLTALVRDAAAPRFPAGRRIIEPQWTVPDSPEPTRVGAVAIDVTPLLAGGENGGAKLVCRSTVQALARLAPDREWLLLTSSHSHHEVADLEGPNVRRHRIDPSSSTLTELLAVEPIAALFSPMTASSFDDPRVPVVCLVHDAQVWAFPEFFDDGDRDVRRRTLEHALICADSIITPSAFTRDAIAAQSPLDSQNIHVIPHTFARERLAAAGDADVSEVLERLGLERDRYFVYPANFWPHKNHLMLLVAFGQLSSRRADLRLDLVLTGANRPDPRPIREAAARMGLTDRVHFTGFVSDSDLAALFAGSLGLVFPSLYEGFGIPVLEAFALDCPVACANVGSLSEVAGDGAMLFDPRKPQEIAAVMERLAVDPALRADLRKRGRARVEALESGEETAARYLAVIEKVIGRARRRRDVMGSVFGDGWSNSTLVVSHAGGPAELHLQVENPRDVAVTLTAPGITPLTVPPETGVFLRCTLPAVPGNLVIAVSPTFRPADSGMSSDTRHLGVRVWSCAIVRPGVAPAELLGEVVHV